MWMDNPCCWHCCMGWVCKITNATLPTATTPAI
ncbi:hypothetical protein Goari_021254, partial [Gossypium aridum]|nr:hypothetical protein [Gossypium aridum]